MRHLATIQRVKDIRPIPNADKIEVCNIQGWEVVIQKDEFIEGELVVYIEIDSIVPSINPYFAFLMDRHYRVRTIKLRKQISQGLVCPMSILPIGEYKEGDDVTEQLGITKYDPQIKEEQEESTSIPKNPLARYMMRYKWFRKMLPKKKNTWPKWIKKTDEERIQNMPWILEKERGIRFSYTEKLDGCSATYFIKKEKNWFGGTKWDFGVCSRNLRLKKKKGHYWEMAKKYDIEKFLKSLNPFDYAILQGEIIGPGIQGNKYKLKEKEFRGFNLLIGSWVYDSVLAKELLEKRSDIQWVPILGEDFKLKDTVQEMVKIATGKSQLCDRKREGIVIRNYNKGISFKVINPEFLLEEE